MTILSDKQRQLVENLPRLQTGFAVEGLREEHEVDGARHLAERFAQLLLIGRQK